MQNSQIIDSAINDYYNNMKFKEIISKYKIGGGTLYRWLKERGLSKRGHADIGRKYPLNTHFFEDINTEKKAYWLGFLYADGCVFDTRTQIILQLADIKHIEKFQSAIETTQPIKIFLNQKSDFGRNQEVKIHDNARIIISSITMSNDLIRQGCYPKKSLTLKFPTIDQVPENLMRHFIRGYFDGDGSLGFIKRKSGQHTYRLSFISSYSFISDLKKYLSDKLKINGTKIQQHIKVYTAQYGGNKQVYKIMEYLFKDATVYLDRKYEIFKTMRSYINRFNFLRNDGEIISFNNITEFCALNPQYKAHSIRRLHNGEKLRYLDLARINS